PEGVRIDLAEYWAGFPDLRVVVEDLIAEGDRVVSRFVLHGTHLNPFLGLAPTGNAVVVPGVAIDRVSGGRLAESWVNLDLFGLVRSPLGARGLGFVS
ncbi:MAG: ester cyclase, partial [Chloroflexota bacterium]|nr:ester cyclase [Chloroflexota bacterium]